MAHLIALTTYSDSRGHLTVIEKEVPFTIKRIFYIYGVDHSQRAAHRHKTTIQALVCMNGSCKVECDNGKEKQTFVLDQKNKCLILQPEDWHIVDQFSSDCILMVMASTPFDESDYIFEPYS